HAIDSAMDDVNFRPVLVMRPAIELAAAEGADGDGEGGVGDFFIEGERLGAIEFLGAMTGEAVGRAAEGAGEHGDSRGISAEVGVKVLDISLPQESQEM